MDGLIYGKSLKQKQINYGLELQESVFEIYRAWAFPNDISKNMT